MLCITDLYDCVNPYTVIILYVLYAYDMFHILLSCDSLRDLWNVYMYVYMYVGIYVCITIIHMNGLAITEREYNGEQA